MKPDSVLASRKFRSAVVGSLASVVLAVVAGFLSSLIPRLPPDKIADVVQHTLTVVSATFAVAIGGSAYVDGKSQENNSPPPVVDATGNPISKPGLS